MIIKPQKNPHKLAFCFSLGCLTQPYGCIHVKRFNSEQKVDAADSSAAAADWLKMQEFNDDGIYSSDDEHRDDQRRADEVEASTPMELPRPTPSTARRGSPSLMPRWSRNMLPCAEEVRLCEHYDAAINAARTENMHCVLPEFFIEEQFYACEKERDDDPDQNVRNGQLHTIRETASIYVCTWTCSDGHLVPFDGSLDALFAATPLIV